MTNVLTLSDFAQHILHQVKKRNMSLNYAELKAVVALSFIDIVQRHSEHPVDENIHDFVASYNETPIMLDTGNGIDIPVLIPYYHVYGDGLIRDFGESYVPFKQYNDVIDAWINVVHQQTMVDITHNFKQTPLFRVPKQYPSFIESDRYLLSDIMAIDLNKFK